MADRMARLSAVLKEAGETHHLVYRIHDGVDPDWASWYADWLINLSELPEILATTPVRSELVYMLVKMGRDHEASGSKDPWEEYYARELVARFAADGA